MNRRNFTQWVVGMALLKGNAALAAIPSAYQRVGRARHVPADILYAVAMAESGSPYQKSQHPWPWALNIAGEGIYCATQQEALQKALDAIALDQSIDLGLMQVSWHWHHQRFQHVSEALVPFNNLNVGAIILREQFELNGDWWKAVGAYHDPGKDQQSLIQAEHYRQKVKQHWEQL
ncbi:MAG: transglycosylase SLT domain-containing protein [Planctomycetaceae bacterium]|nr:transglycosylase SLT domain-containing protein [Planctomycetaceae bacterium]